MALVMLPCDMPWWPQLQRHLTQLALCHTPRELIEGMHKIYSMCNIGLDPDEDEKPDPSVFQELARYLECDVTGEDTRHIVEKTIPAMVHRALQLKQLKPPRGLCFSLQQQADRVEIDRNFLASLLAHAFFSTFPKRTLKTHPTLQDFNFSRFFKHLGSNSQKAKLRSILHYFDLLETSDLPDGKILFSRQVMSSKEWLTIEDWLECALPLCPLAIRHEGRLDRAEPTTMAMCFSTSRLGGKVLDEGSSQESIQFCTHPEILPVMQFVEALEDNEVLMVEGVLQVARISDPHLRAVFEPIHKPSLVSVCCIDAENYMRLPLSQFEEDNILRELNKALLAFRQQHKLPPPQPITRRLSPIGESFSSTPTEVDTMLAVHKDSPSKPSRLVSDSPTRQKDLLRPPSPTEGRRGRFIVLGSSGECLPVTRSPVASRNFLAPRQSDSGSEEYHSAKSSLDADEDSDVQARRYSAQLDTPERRSTFAARLRDALCHEAQSSSSTDSSYAVGISVAGSGLTDRDIKVKRGGSRGFMLRDDSLECQFLQECQQQEWLDQCHTNRGGKLARRDTSQSSKYSFSTDYGSELEELYDQYSRWLEDAESPNHYRELNARDIAVVRFAGSLLKRTLSESFAGVPVTELQGPAWDAEKGKTKLAMVARSLSLELARQKHRLAAQLVSMLAVPGSTSGLRHVATGNWGCGSTQVGEPQLKMALQWLAASVAGIPSLQYYTCGHHKLLKLDTVCRVLVDRQWTVGELTRAVLRYAQNTLHSVSPTPSSITLFDELIGGGDKAAAVTIPVPGV